MAKFVSRKTVKRNSFKEMAEETWNRRVESTCGIDVLPGYVVIAEVAPRNIWNNSQRIKVKKDLQLL